MSQRYKKNCSLLFNKPGPPGPPGERDDTGPQGRQGDTGPSGLQGRPGDTGPIGSPGSQGDPGINGRLGDTGSTGAQGIQGDTGAIGGIGDVGLSGAQGGIGDTGPENGDIGPEGPVGPQGPVGPTGPPGIPGVMGLQGVVGPQGFGQTGPQGILGDTGSIGAQGNTGATGAAGIGATGMPGIIGDMGGQRSFIIPFSSGSPFFLSSAINETPLDAAYIGFGDFTSISNPVSLGFSYLNAAEYLAANMNAFILPETATLTAISVTIVNTAPANVTFDTVVIVDVYAATPNSSSFAPVNFTALLNTNPNIFAVTSANPNFIPKQVISGSRVAVRLRLLSRGSSMQITASVGLKFV